MPLTPPPAIVDVRPAREVSRVRSHNERVIAAMSEAQRRSRTFRALLDRIERSDLIVYLESGHCGHSQVLSCLSVTAGAHAERYLRITIDTEHPRDMVIRQIAHELQHAVELAGAPQVVDGDSLRRFYRRIGTADMMVADTFETIAAVAVAAAVGGEIK